MRVGGAGGLNYEGGVGGGGDCSFLQVAKEYVWGCLFKNDFLVRGVVCRCLGEGIVWNPLSEDIFGEEMEKVSEVWILYPRFSGAWRDDGRGGEVMIFRGVIAMVTLEFVVFALMGDNDKDGGFE